MASSNSGPDARAADDPRRSFQRMPASPPIARGAETTEVAGFLLTDEVLGKGRYSKVVKAKHLRTGEEVACKIIVKKDVSEQTMQKLTREVTTLQKLRHRNIIQLYEALETPSHLYIFMQYARGGELYDYLVAHGRLSEKEARAKFRSILSAVYYCHQRGICHRDLKVENILLDADMNVMISDFGLSNVFKEGQLLDTFCGSFSYVAPEVLVRRPYSGPEVDVWALGVLLFVMIAGSLPFKTDTDIMAGRFSRVPDISTSCLRVFKMIFKPEPRMRPSLAEVMRSTWVNETFGPDSLFIGQQPVPPGPMKALESQLSRETSTSEPDQQTPSGTVPDTPSATNSGHATPHSAASPLSLRDRDALLDAQPSASGQVTVVGALPDSLDSDILFLMCNKYGYDANRVRTSVGENLFDSTMATYLILLDRKMMFPKQHAADMRAANALVFQETGSRGPKKAASSPHIAGLEEERSYRVPGSPLRERQSMGVTDQLRAQRRSNESRDYGPDDANAAGGVSGREMSRVRSIGASEPALNDNQPRRASGSRGGPEAEQAAMRSKSEWAVKNDEAAASETSIASSSKKKNDTDGPKPRTVRFPFSVKSTSPLPPKELCGELVRVLNKLGIAFENPEPFVFFCRKDNCEWEVEICKVPLLSVHGCKFRRLAGDAEEYRNQCSRILDTLKMG